MKLGLVLAAIAIAATLAAPAGGSERHASACATTARASGLPDPSLKTLSRTWWKQNGVWMGVAGSFHGEGFKADPEGQKIAFYRDRVGYLHLYGKRLDGPPASFTATISNAYGTKYFQPTGITFGAAGCWAVTAVVGSGASRFVVEVAPAT